MIEPLRPLFDEVICARSGKRAAVSPASSLEAPPTGEARALIMADYAQAHRPRPPAERGLRRLGQRPADARGGRAIPVAVNPETKLAAIARKRGWHVEHWPKAPGRAPAPAADRSRPSRRRRDREGAADRASVRPVRRGPGGVGVEAGRRRPGRARCGWSTSIRPALPGPDWQVVRPRLSGICGSDLATVDGRSSRWFEPIVSFPFVPGHEVVGDADDGRRVVIEPVLHCRIRGIDPPCPPCAAGQTNHCERLIGRPPAARPADRLTAPTPAAAGPWRWSPTTCSCTRCRPAGRDEAAVMVEPTACAVHGALAARPRRPRTDGRGCVIGAGTLGLATIAAIRQLRPDITSLLAVAKHPEQRRLARELGATAVVEPGELRRAVRRATGSWILDSGQLTGGAARRLRLRRQRRLDRRGPGGRRARRDASCCSGMPGHVGVDLTGLWQREIRLVGAYAYGPEPAAGGRHSFDLAMERGRGGRPGAAGRAPPTPSTATPTPSSTPPRAGRRGAVKVAFDLRGEKRR